MVCSVRKGSFDGTESQRRERVFGVCLFISAEQANLRRGHAFHVCLLDDGLIFSLLHAIGQAYGRQQDNEIKQSCERQR